MSAFNSYKVEKDGLVLMEATIQLFFNQEGGRAKAAAQKIADLIADGSIEIDMTEGYDSCGSCGGYHGVMSGCGD